MINKKKNIPGPGTYENKLEINKLGVYSISSMANSKAAAWSPSKKRFIDLNKHRLGLPGPGEYDTSDYQGGVYVLSTFRNHGAVKIQKDSHSKMMKLR